MAKIETNDTRINKLMRENMFYGMFLCIGIDALKQIADQKEDEEVVDMFLGLFPAHTLRSHLAYMHKQLFPDQYQESNERNR